MPDMRGVDMWKELARMEREVREPDWNSVIPDDAYTSAVLNPIPQAEIDAKWESLFSDIPRWTKPWWLLRVLGLTWIMKLIPRLQRHLLFKMKATPEYREREDRLWLWASHIPYTDEKTGRRFPGR